MNAFKNDPLVTCVSRLLIEDHDDLIPAEVIDVTIAALGITASEQKWYHLMQLCLPLLCEPPVLLQEVIEPLNDEQMLMLLTYGQRINDAIHLKLHGRAAVAERLRMVRRPARRFNLPWTDRWVSTDTVREMLADIRSNARKRAPAKRQKWAVDQLHKRCAAINARMMDATDYQLMRHAMATGSQWMRLTHDSQHESAQVRIHYASGLMSVRFRCAGMDKTKRTILPLLIGKMLADEERQHIDRHFAINFLSMRVFETLWMLRTREELEQLLPRLQWFHAHLLGDLLADPEVEACLAAMGPFPTLVVTTHGALAQLPFAALHDGGRYLAERFNIIQTAPLLPEDDFEVGEIDYAALLGGRSLESRSLRILAGGEGLPQIAHELDDLRALTQNGRLSIEMGPDGDAEPWTDDHLRRLFTDKGMALLSAHMRSSASDAAQAVVITPQSDELAIGSALTQPIHADLVVLSSCHSAGYTDWLAPGESSVISLLRSAGAQTVVSTLWPIRDYPTRLYNVALFSALANGASRASAHGTAQRAVFKASASIGQLHAGERLAKRKSGKNSENAKPDAVSTALDHPYYWASWTPRRTQ